MAFRAGAAAGPCWSEERPSRDGAEDWILTALAGRDSSCILELGPASGQRAAWLLRRLTGADYRGFEPSPRWAATATAAIAVFAERASVEQRNLALQLPIGEATQNLVLCLDLLEYLRMDSLYMTLAEARRALLPGGLCVLRTLSFTPGARGSAAAALRQLALRFRPSVFGGSRPLELHHYISPEDWRIVSETRAPDGWLSRQTVVLERL